MSAAMLPTARAEVLFVSDLSATTSPNRAQVEAAIRRAMRAHGGQVRKCLEDVASEYGEHPETAAARMRWAKSVVASVYGRTAVTR